MGRHREQQGLVASAQEQLSLAPLTTSDVLGGGGPAAGTLRMAAFEGVFAGEPMLVVGHYESSEPGYRVVMPFFVGGDPGFAILVDRGWLPEEGFEGHLAALPGQGRVEGIAAHLPAWDGDPRLEGNRWRGFAPMEMEAAAGAKNCSAQVLAGGGCGCCQITKSNQGGVHTFVIWYDCDAHEGWWGDENEIPPTHGRCGIQVSTRDVKFEYFSDPSGNSNMCNPQSWCFFSCCDPPEAGEAVCLFSGVEVVSVNVVSGCPHDCAQEALNALDTPTGYTLHCTVCAV